MPDSQIKKSCKSRKSRKRKHKTKNEQCQRVIEWETSLSHHVEIKLKNNSMTQIYYTKRLLLIYAKEIHDCRMQDRSCIFQEDNDSSHDTRSAINIVQSYKKVNWIETLIHFSQSSDLNSSEEVWNILKQRVRRQRCSNVTKLKRVILEEWDKISMNEIRARIREMPDRCRRVAKNEKAIKSDLW